ncbi:MAG: hypothetical protein H7A01_07070 [Hahellaceae bacterium]|nr:hypothetical protein [Hahellaceae bacterium]MCP5211724.1 hypothetical protein [Hahellaceae bacterium]
MKILHAPVNTANIGGLLRKGQRLLGHKADVHDIKNTFQYDIDYVIERYIGDRNDNLASIFEYFSRVLRENYDIYHFYYYGSLFPRAYGIPPFLDIDLLKGVGNKKFFFHLVGCDFRIPEISYTRNTSSMCLSCGQCRGLDKLDVLQKILERSDGLIVGGPHSNLFLPGLSTNTLPNPVDTDNLNAGNMQRKRPVIIHIPTNRDIKGTNKILNAIGLLKAKGIDFDFKLLEGANHVETMRNLENADILIDQTGSDFYGTAAIEAMSLGTVVLTGILPETHSQLGEKAPVYAINNESIGEVLEDVILDHKKRKIIAQEAIAYVREFHDYRKVAEMSLKIYDHGAPPLSSATKPSDIINDLRQQIIDCEKSFLEARENLTRLNSGH